MGLELPKQVEIWERKKRKANERHNAEQDPHIRAFLFTYVNYCQGKIDDLTNNYFDDLIEEELNAEAG